VHLPSSSTASTQPTAWAWRFPATSIAPGRIRAGSLASLSIDQPSPLIVLVVEVGYQVD
jgi:hypothetical protein